MHFVTLPFLAVSLIKFMKLMLLLDTVSFIGVLPVGQERFLFDVVLHSH